MALPTPRYPVCSDNHPPRGTEADWRETVRIYNTVQRKECTLIVDPIKSCTAGDLNYPILATWPFSNALCKARDTERSASLVRRPILLSCSRIEGLEAHLCVRCRRVFPMPKFHTCERLAYTWLSHFNDKQCHKTMFASFTYNHLFYYLI